MSYRFHTRNTMEVKPNEAIGIVVAQQCSAPAVQTSLSAFHQVGTSVGQKVNLGQEYSSYLRLQTSIESSTTYIYPKDPSLIKDLMFELQNVCLKDIIDEYFIGTSPYLNKFLELHEVKAIGFRPGRCLTLKLKKDMMYHHKIDPYQIKYIIESNVCDTLVIPSPLARATIDILCPSDSEGKLSNMYQGLFQDVKGSTTALKNFQIKGIPNIWPIRIFEDKYIECKGCNVPDLVNHPMIDSYKSFTNNIKETFKFYGNIATRQIIKTHIKNLFKNDVDDKALDILIGNMMYKGYPMSVAQDGVQQQNRSLLFKMTYERFIDHVHDVPFVGYSPVGSIYDKLAIGFDGSH